MRLIPHAAVLFLCLSGCALHPATAAPKPDDFMWNGVEGHFVAVVDVQESIAENEHGFRFAYADSSTGRVEYGFIHAERTRNFTAIKGDNVHYQWISDFPFTLVTAPALPMGIGKQPWYLRTTVTLNSAVFRPCPTAQDAPPRKPAPQPSVLHQRNIGSEACGPCAIYNSLTHGDPALVDLAHNLPGATDEERVRNLIAIYGSRPSEAYGAALHRYDPAKGITWLDEFCIVRDMLSERAQTSVEWCYLDRQADESGDAQLRRIHRLLRDSLRAGFPPIISLRSFAAAAR